jgi:hypothetical protein
MSRTKNFAKDSDMELDTALLNLIGRIFVPSSL